jgi:putative membrane protein
MMHWFGFGWSGFLVMVLVWGLLIAAAVALVKALFSGGTANKEIGLHQGDQALDILKQRYARGEINQKEYETIKQDLSKP